MKKSLIPLALVGLMYQGCTNNVVQPNTPVKFYTPSKLSVIKEGSKIYIQGLHDHKYKSSKLHKGIKNYFEKDNIFKVVNSIKSADIVISVNTFYSYRADDSSDTKYNKKYFVKREVYKNSRGKTTGGKDKLLMSNHSSSTATLITTVSIYDKKNLEPLVYFNVTPTDTSKVIMGKSSTIYKSSNAFNSKFTNDVISKINDLVTTKDKNVNVFIPKNGNAKLKSSLLNANFKDLFKNSKSVLPAFAISEVSMKKYEDIKKQASVKGSKIQKRDLETDLSNFYIYYMAKESTDISAKNIKDVHKSYKKIISLTKNESLILACANSLGRVEFKADRLKINLGDE